MAPSQLEVNGIMAIHTQTLVKVNAKVDKRIAPLVDALNACPGVFTTSSCEGGKFKDAYVAFDVGGCCCDLVAFVNTLSSSLGGADKVCDLQFTLSIEWYAGGNTPNGYLRVPRQHIHALADAIRSTAADFVATARRSHSSRSPGDTGCRGPRSCSGRHRRQRLPPSGGERANCQT
jgi:Methyltransferase TYW3